jgi:hypothetical protein
MYSSDKNYGMWLSIFDSANNLFSDYSRYIHPWKIYLHPPCIRPRNTKSSPFAS